MPRPLAALGLLLAIAGVAHAQTPAAIFAPVVAYRSGLIYSQSIAADDVNGGGRPDLLTTNIFADVAGGFSEPVTGFAVNGICVTNGTVSGGTVSGSGSGPYTFSVTPMSSNMVAVSVLAGAAQDAVGNVNTASTSVQCNVPNQTSTDTAMLNSAGTYALTMQVQDNGSSGLASSSTITMAVTPVTQVLDRLNASGPDLNTRLVTFAADQYFSSSRIGANSRPVTSTTDDALYQTELFEEAFSYALRVLNGTYQVVLNFAELYWTQTGQRIFDVRVESQLVPDNYDILRKVAPFTITTDGVFNLQSDGGATRSSAWPWRC